MSGRWGGGSAEPTEQRSVCGEKLEKHFSHRRTLTGRLTQPAWEEYHLSETGVLIRIYLNCFFYFCSYYFTTYCAYIFKIHFCSFCK